MLEAVVVGEEPPRCWLAASVRLPVAAAVLPAPAAVVAEEEAAAAAPEAVAAMLVSAG